MDKANAVTSPITPVSIAALAVAAVVAFVNYRMVGQQVLADESTTVITLSSRQPLLVQQTALLAQRLVNAQDPIGRAELRKGLLDSAKLMERIHAGLVNGEKGLNLPGRPSPQVRSIYFEPTTLLDTQMRTYLDELMALSRASDAELTPDNPSLHYIQTTVSGRELLDALDALVNQYYQERNLRISGLRRLEMGLFLLTVFLLLVTVWLMARPRLRQLRQERETGLRALNETIEQRAKELARSNAELEQFAYVASHDLQEPLRMVASYCQLLQKRYQGKLDADADEFIGYAIDGVIRMQALINDLLTYARVGTRGKPFEPIDCVEVVDRTLANLTTAIEETHAVVTSNGLPTVMADGTQLTQLLQNLISNAVKFHTSDAPPRVQIEATRDGQETAWVFSVRDNGIGIAPEHRERIFGIFQRLHTSREYPGTGIGLAVCKKIVERHGGRIWVESTPGHGATFSFTIPDQQA